MAQDRRKIATVLAAEVVDHAQMVSTDPEVRPALQTMRDTLLQCIERHGGRCFGDEDFRLTAEFAHAADALRCAVEAQQAIHRANVAPPKSVHVRMGLAAGDVHELEDNLEGEGVELAVQIQGLAVPGGICLGGSVYEHVKHRVHVGFDFVGQRPSSEAFPIPLRSIRSSSRGSSEASFLSGRSSGAATCSASVPRTRSSHGC